MTDWPRRLRLASFAGQPFWVLRGEQEAGHRVSTTAIPNARHINEAFGPAARRFEIEAYLSGPACQERAAALLDAAETRHLGTLVLPDSGPHEIRLTKARRAFERDKLGYVGLDLEAVAEPPKLTGGLSPAALASGVFSAGAVVPAALGAFAGAAFQLAASPATIVEAAAGAAAGALGDLAGIAAGSLLDAAATAVLQPALDTALGTLADFAVAPALFGEALGAAAIVLGDVAEPARLLESVVAAGLPLAPLAPVVSQGSALIEFAHAGAAVTLAAGARALALGEAMARAEFTDRPAALEARAVASAVFDDALGRIDGRGLALADALRGMGGLVTDLTVAIEGGIAPLVVLDQPQPLPALVTAWELYADPGRADEVARRAGAAHPGAMPRRFEALAD